MIAKTSSGRSFVGLQEYLIHGRDRDQENRAEWTVSRNLGTDDPELAAALMRATAAQNPRVEYPVYHLTIAFDPDDPVNREMMERVADRALNELGLSEHQALLVAHNDREHAHVHIMVNRVHPDTLRAWERWQDRPAIERVLREEEHELGLRSVPGTLYERDSQELARRDRAVSEEFTTRVKEHLPDYRTARTWDDLENRLNDHGLRLERKSQGLVITDGEYEVKASLVARDLSLRRLEGRFGGSYEEHRNERAPRGLESTERDVTDSVLRRHESVSPAVAEVASAIRERERLDALYKELSNASSEKSSIQYQVNELSLQAERIKRASQDVAAEFRRVYREPGAAHSQFLEAAEFNGQRAVATFRSSPEVFGELLTSERKRAFGLLIETYNDPARHAAIGVSNIANGYVNAKARLEEMAKSHVTDAEKRFDRALNLVYQQPEHARAAFEQALKASGREAVLEVLKERPDRLGSLAKTEETLVGRESPTARIAAWHLSERAGELIDARAATTAAMAISQMRQQLHGANDRERQIQNAVHSTPGRNMLEHTIARGLSQLEPNELTQLRRVLTDPQRAIAFKLGERIRDVVLGRDDELER